LMGNVDTAPEDNGHGNYVLPQKYSLQHDAGIVQQKLFTVASRGSSCGFQIRTLPSIQHLVARICP
jgi:hypothetical protein